MRVATAAAFALILVACSHDDETAAGKTETRVATLPPPLFQDCVEFNTLDDTCTRSWYECRLGSPDGASCRTAWEQCCTFRGQGNRSRMAKPIAEPVDR